jgi:hypothetical protein
VIRIRNKNMSICANGRPLVQNRHKTYSATTMQVDYAFHPALAGIIPNPPSLDDDDNGDHSDGPLLGTRELPSHRNGKGRIHLAAALNYWMGRSDFSHSDLSSIADWAVSEDGWLISSQISHIRNSNVRSAGFRNLEALGEVNKAIWSWKVEGPEMCRVRYGATSKDKVTTEKLDNAIWLHHPNNEAQPLEFAHFCEIAVGRLNLDYIKTFGFTPTEARDFNFNLARLLDAAVMGTGLGIREGLAKVLTYYPGNHEKSRAKRLQGVILGQQLYTQKELENEIDDLANLVRTLKGLPKDSFGPADLRSLLSSLS